MEEGCLHVGLDKHGRAAHACCRHSVRRIYVRLRACRARSGTMCYANGNAVSRQAADWFRVRPRPAKAPRSGRTARFTTLVLREARKSGAKRSNRFQVPTLARLGRGHVAASMSGLSLPANARRVIIKCRFLVVKDAGARSVATHLRYIEREGVDRAGQCRDGGHYVVADELELSAQLRKYAGRNSHVRNGRSQGTADLRRRRTR